MISIIIPTYNEKENIKKLILNVFKLVKESLEIIVIDDNSPDGTSEEVKFLARAFNVRLVKRGKKSGLSSAVVEGFKVARGEVIGVMDADFSHPPEKIPEFIKFLTDRKYDMVVGSRYIKGGGVRTWSSKRKAISKVAIFLAKPLTPIKDPVSGFFFLRKEVIKDINLSPKGYKIGLEVIVKGRYKKIKEIPYVFVGRKKGRSKMNLNEIFNYVCQLFGLYFYKLKSQL